MSEFWDRYVEVQIGSKIFSLEDYDIEFEIENSDSEEAGLAEIAVWNLGESKDVFKVDEFVQLKAGYKNDYGVIFLGKIDKVVQERNKADIKTVAKCSDFTKELFRKKIYKVYSEGTSIKAIVSDLLAEAGIPVGKIEDPGINIEKKTVFGGKTNSTIFNVISEEILPLVNGEGKQFKFYVGTDGLGYFVKEDYRGNEVIVLDSESGLIEVRDKSDEEEQKYAVRCLLNWKIKQDMIVKIDSFVVSGNFKVSRLKHVCRSEDYYTELEVIPL
ncbi:MAG: hypothetical protein QXV61_00205 [Archaeoglobaceae archaeon]